MDYKSTINTALNVWSKILGQVTGAMSIIIFESTLGFSNKLQVGIVTVVACLSYSAFDYYLRKILVPRETAETLFWRVSLVDIFDFLFSVAIFLITQWITFFISSEDSFGSSSLAEKITTIFSVVVCFAMVVTILKNFGSKKENGHSRVQTFARVWSSIFGTVVQFLSRSLLKEMLKAPNQLQVAIASLVVVGTYITVDWVVRRGLEKIEKTPERRVFFSFITELLDFGYTMSIFLPIFYFGEYLNELTRTGVMNLSEQIAAIFSAALVIHSTFAILTELSESNSGKWMLADTANRVWGKISGTVYGTFAQIFTAQIYANPNRGQIILVVLIASFAYLTVDNSLRSGLGRIQNKEWVSVLNEMLDFFFSLGFLIPLDYYSTEVTENFSGDTYSFSEVLVSVLSVVFISYPIFSVLKVLVKEKKKQ